MGALLTWMVVQVLSTLKFSLPNGLQKSNDPTAFIGSQYVSHAVEANLPLNRSDNLADCSARYRSYMRDSGFVACRTETAWDAMGENLLLINA